MDSHTAVIRQSVLFHTLYSSRPPSFLSVRLIYSLSQAMSHANYGEKTYWDSRYSGQQIETYEWYLTWEQLKDYILKPVHALHTTETYVPTQSGIDLNTATAAAATAATTAATPTAPSPSSVEPSPSNTESPSVQPSSSGIVAAASPPCVSCQSFRYLIVGCGNSELSAHMWYDGFTNTESIDYSEIVIDKMRTLYSQHAPELSSSFKVGDCRNLHTPDHTYDVILDKGTLDAILCGADSNKHQAAMLTEMHRVLKRGEET